MSFIQKLFGGGTPATPMSPTIPPVNQPPGSATQQNPGDPTLGTQQTQLTAPNGVIPTQPAKEESPLDKHAELWKTPDTDPNTKPPQGLFDNFDPQKMMEAAGKVDFTKIITPDQLQKITAGGPEAAVAFAESLNKVAQTVYGQSAVATANITKKALDEQETRIKALLPSLVKHQGVDDSLVAANALYANPAVQPLVEALKTQLITKHPQASASEIQSHIVGYLADIGKTFAPKVEAPRNPNTPQEYDWSKFESLP